MAASEKRSHHQVARPDASSHNDAIKEGAASIDASYLRPPNEDDDGYDPYSDRPATGDPLFERDPWS